MNKRWISVVVWGALIGLTGIVIVALIGLKQWYRENLLELGRTMAGEIYIGWLASPNAYPEVFAALETQAHNIQQRHGNVEDLLISYITAGGGEKIVFPLSLYFAGPPEPGEKPWYKLPLQSGGQVLGFMYIQFDNTTQYWLDVLVWVASLGLLGLVVGIGVRIQRSASQIRRTLDLIEQKQRQLFQMERLARIGQLSANLLHDLKKPILNIQEELGAWEDDASPAHIREQVQLFRSLVAEFELERYMGASQIQPEYLDIQEIITKTLRLVSYEQREVTINIDLAPDLPFVWGVEHQMIQILSNLFSNAYSAMDGGGTLCIKAHGLTRRGIRFVRVQVTDSGPGIAPVYQQKIFDPFFTTGPRETATGLGLYIVKSLVENMGGTVTCESCPGHGATFVVSVPAAEEPEDEP